MRFASQDYLDNLQRASFQKETGLRKKAAQWEEEVQKPSSPYTVTLLCLLLSHWSSKRGHVITFQRKTRCTHTLACSDVHRLMLHLPRDPFGQGLSTVSPFRVGGHWTPRATRPSHPPTWPGPPGAMGTRRGGRGVSGTMAVIGRWSKGPLLMTPIGCEADGRTGVRATVAV